MPLFGRFVIWPSGHVAAVPGNCIRLDGVGVPSRRRRRIVSKLPGFVEDDPPTAGWWQPDSVLHNAENELPGKAPFSHLVIWPFALVAPPGQMCWWLHALMPKWQTGQMATWPNGKMARWPNDQAASSISRRISFVGMKPIAAYKGWPAAEACRAMRVTCCPRHHSTIDSISRRATPRRRYSGSV